jgi:hypothetical protein
MSTEPTTRWQLPRMTCPAPSTPEPPGSDKDLIDDLRADLKLAREERDKALNAGWNAALKAVGQEASKLCGWDLSSINRRLSKPVATPLGTTGSTKEDGNGQ